MTSAQNICSDFSFLCGWSAEQVFACITTIAVVVGVAIANRQLQNWRSERLGLRRAEIAEELLATAHQAAWHLDSVRRVSERLPLRAAETRDQQIIEEKWERLIGGSNLFDDLRLKQIRERTLNGDPAVYEAVETLFQIRQEVYAALSTLHGWERSTSESPEDRAFRKELWGKLTNVNAAENETSIRQGAAISILDNKLIPIARLAKGKLE